jgi:broad specificity phosphatase PhoE
MLFAAFVLPLLRAQATDLTFVRHGETVANATGKYNSRTLNAFSVKGQAGVDALTKRLLASPKFDRILVSPAPRALYTIAPYLRASHQRAVVWPLLYECCTGRRPAGAKATKFTDGPKITLPADIAPLFTIQPGHDRFPNSPDYNAGLAQVAAAVNEFRTRIAGGRVLLVGHSAHGGQFLHALTGKWIQVKNATEIKLRIQ